MPPTPPSTESKKKWEEMSDKVDRIIAEGILDQDNDRVGRAMANIGNLDAFDRDELSKLLARGEG
jgi:hypothetical protein